MVGNSSLKLFSVQISLKIQSRSTIQHNLIKEKLLEEHIKTQNNPFVKNIITKPLDYISILLSARESA